MFDVSDFFPSESREQILCLMMFQESLISIDSGRVDEVVEHLLQTNLIYSKDSVKQIAYNILQAASHRPWSIKNLVSLIKKLIDNASSDNCLSILKDFLIPTDLMNQRWYRSFLLFAISQKIISAEELINLMKSYDVDEPLFLLYCWFAPIIEKSDHDIFLQLTDMLFKNKNKLSKEFQFFIDKFEQLRMNNWELQREYFLTGYYKGSLPYIIRNDNLDLLRSYFSQFNVEIDYNMKVDSSLFERCDFIRHNPTLIQFAAYYGSVKCFTYLLMQNDIDIKITDDNGINIFQFAIAGGNQKIIEICEKLKFENKGIIETAIEFQRFDTMVYFIEKYKININDCDDSHLSVLHYAAKYNNVKVILYCLKNKVDVNLKDNQVHFFVLMFLSYL